MAPRVGIGLMSGTSVDAVDAALVEIDASRRPPVKLLNYVEYPIPPPLKRRLRDVMRPDGVVSAAELCQLNVEVGRLFSDAAREVAGSALPTVQWVGSHGQTIAHVPCSDVTRGWRTPSTLQIGEPSEMAQALGITVVADFRPRDVACGGGGAPLMPAAEAVLFRHLLSSSSSRAAGEEDAAAGESGMMNDDNVPAIVLQNIGGMGSLTALSASGDVLTSFDTGPGNMVMDLLVQGSGGTTVDEEEEEEEEVEKNATPHDDNCGGDDDAQQQQQYDVDGRLAAAGRVLTRALEWAQSHPFFALSPPRSGGHEHFGASFVAQFKTRCEAAAACIDVDVDVDVDGVDSVAGDGGRRRRGASTSDAVRTALELTAVSIVASIRHHVVAHSVGQHKQYPSESGGLSVLLSGGGANNPVLVERLKSLAPELRWRTTAGAGGAGGGGGAGVGGAGDGGVDPDAKEAVGFAVLGYLTLAGVQGNTIATGARVTSVLGKICHPGPGKTIPIFEPLL